MDLLEDMLLSRTVATKVHIVMTVKLGQQWHFHQILLGEQLHQDTLMTVPQLQILKDLWQLHQAEQQMLIPKTELVGQQEVHYRHPLLGTILHLGKINL